MIPDPLARNYNPNDLAFNWSCVSFNSTDIQFKLNFIKPKAISKDVIIYIYLK